MIVELLQGLLLAGCAVQLGFVRREVRRRAGCLCRKGAISPWCPRHGWER